MTVHYEDDRVRLLHGDALSEVASLPSGSVQTVVTSPPYFGLRDYGEDGQYGAEASVDEFVSRLVSLFREVRRALSSDGTVWLNLGDTYASKTLSGVPWRVALALVDDGWLLRSEIIWQKPNAMPESVTDRPSRSHEHLFLLAPSADYYYDADAIRETYDGDRSASRRARSGANKVNAIQSAYTPDEAGTRNKRTVWPVATSPFPGAHFATYPPELVRPCIRAASRPGDTVLDPFSGSGTTGMVALQEGRKYVGIDLNADYLDLSLRERFQEQPLDIFGGAA